MLLKLPGFGKILGINGRLFGIPRLWSDQTPVEWALNGTDWGGLGWNGF